MAFLKKNMGVLLLVAAALFITIGVRHFLMPANQSGSYTEGAPTIGGPFELVDAQGQIHTHEDYKGKVLIIYFGYTFCPDICPTTMATIASAYDRLSEDERADVNVVFVSVDHERDKPPMIDEYAKAFHPAFVGLGGDAQQIRAASKAYKVYYAIVDAVDKDGNENPYYAMDHSTITYMMGREGTYGDHLGHDATADDVVEKIRALL